jgi:hypothetical protein
LNLTCSFDVDEAALIYPVYGVEKGFNYSYSCFSPSGAPGYQRGGYLVGSAGRANLSCAEAPVWVTVKSATYGGNVGVPTGNVTEEVSRRCNTADTCVVTVSPALYDDDPAPGKTKDFRVEYACPESTITHVAYLQPGADGQTVPLTCKRDPEALKILSATYGSNCGATTDNVLDVVSNQICSGQSTCSFGVTNQLFGDKAPNCRKDLSVRYVCGNDLSSKTVTAPEGSKSSWDARPRRSVGPHASVSICTPFLSAHCSLSPPPR